MRLLALGALMLSCQLGVAQECWLMRHGEPGPSGDLSPAGQTQARAAAATWSASAAAVVVMTSPVARCRQTAEIVSTTLGVAAPTVVTWLAEDAEVPTDLPPGAILVLVTHAPVIYRWAQVRGITVDRAIYASPIKLP